MGFKHGQEAFYFNILSIDEATFHNEVAFDMNSGSFVLLGSYEVARIDCNFI